MVDEAVLSCQTTSLFILGNRRENAFREKGKRGEVDSNSRSASKQIRCDSIDNDRIANRILSRSGAGRRAIGRAERLASFTISLPGVSAYIHHSIANPLATYISRSFSVDKPSFPVSLLFAASFPVSFLFAASFHSSVHFTGSFHSFVHFTSSSTSIPSRPRLVASSVHFASTGLITDAVPACGQRCFSEQNRGRRLCYLRPHRRGGVVLDLIHLIYTLSLHRWMILLFVMLLRLVECD
ncbi:hypothetical protein MRB53_015282 [Persea americana]|uniref:Uncharacterized protein n=1 Tax=Persea americana TaxID=3435 RepID=A0ACC2KDD5_PERAE|nr:hypothetical protein MRB53_015282 [Persea americana]